MRRIRGASWGFIFFNLLLGWLNLSVVDVGWPNYIAAVFAIGNAIAILWFDMHAKPKIYMQGGRVSLFSGREPNTGDPPYGTYVPPTDTVLAGEIIAWRAWRTDGTTLYSTYMGCKWEPDKPMTGAPGAGFGIFAMKDRGEVEHFFGGGCVIGQVALWGDVIEHTHGYRAENARIVSLDSCGHIGDCAPLRKLQKTYKVGFCDKKECVDSSEWTGRKEGENG